MPKSSSSMPVERPADRRLPDIELTGETTDGVMVLVQVAKFQEHAKLAQGRVGIVKAVQQLGTVVPHAVHQRWESGSPFPEPGKGVRLREVQAYWPRGWYRSSIGR